MYHSVIFGDKNTWRDWHLVPTSRPVVSPPPLKSKTVDIPGGDGVIDLSDSLTGYPVFGRRTGSFEFIVVNDFYEPVNTYEEWHVTYSNIMNYLHGKKMEMALEDDPDYWYEGRFTVGSWTSDRSHSKITINYDLEPYKWYKTKRTLKLLAEKSTKYYYLNPSVDHMGSAPVVPRVDVFPPDSTTTGATITFTNNRTGYSETYDLTYGTYYPSGMVFYGDRCVISYKILDVPGVLYEYTQLTFTWEEGEL